MGFFSDTLEEELYSDVNCEAFWMGSIDNCIWSVFVSIVYHYAGGWLKSANSTVSISV